MKSVLSHPHFNDRASRITSVCAFSNLPPILFSLGLRRSPPAPFSLRLVVGYILLCFFYGTLLFPPYSHFIPFTPDRLNFCFVFPSSSWMTVFCHCPPPSFFLLFVVLLLFFLRPPFLFPVYFLFYFSSSCLLSALICFFCFPS